MPLEIRLETRRCPLDRAEEERIRRQLRGLERRLADFAWPLATAVLEAHPPQRRVTVSLRLDLIPDGEPLVSHEAAETPAKAVRLAVEDVADQLEERLANQRGEHTYGVPSRRLPKALRPHPPAGAGGTAPAEEAEGSRSAPGEEVSGA